MSRKENNKYHIPVELTVLQEYKWLNVKTYDYKIYADDIDGKFSRIRFIDINGFIIGEHMPTKLHTVYDKAASQVKNTTVKAVKEIKNVVEDVADLAVGVAAEVKQDVSTTADAAVGIFSKVKTFAKNKFSKNEINK